MQQQICGFLWRHERGEMTSWYRNDNQLPFLQLLANLNQTMIDMAAVGSGDDVNYTDGSDENAMLRILRPK